jgi:hypothetical protein
MNQPSRTAGIGSQDRITRTRMLGQNSRDWNKSEGTLQLGREEECRHWIGCFRKAAQDSQDRREGWDRSTMATRSG